MTSVNSKRTVLPQQLHILEYFEYHLRLRFLLFKDHFYTVLSIDFSNAQAFTLPHPCPLPIQSRHRKSSSNKLFKAILLLTSLKLVAFNYSWQFQKKFTLFTFLAGIPGLSVNCLFGRHPYYKPIEVITNETKKSFVEVRVFAVDIAEN